MTTETVACRCGFLSRPGPFCQACGSPLKQRQTGTEAAAFLPARQAPAGPLRTIPVHQSEARPEPSIPDAIMCDWCAAMSPPGPACQTCGSPLDTGNLVREAEVRLGQDSTAERRRLRLITPPPEEGSEPDERRVVGN